MELRHLRYFVAVADERNFTSAAKRLRVAQPALSQQIRALEEELDVSLFERGTRPVTLSAAGESFIIYARRILSEANEASDVAKRASRGEVGSLTLAFSCVASAAILTRLVRKYRKAFPKVQLRLHEMTPAVQFDALASGKIQIAYTRRFEDPLKSYDFLDVFQDRYLVALPDGHPFARKKEIALSMLANEDFILFNRSDTPNFYNQVFTSCLQAGFSPHVVSEADVLQTILIMIDAGAGVSVIPSCVMGLRRNGVALVPLVERIEPDPVGLAWAKKRENPILSSFVAVARAHKRSLAKEILPPKWIDY